VHESTEKEAVRNWLIANGAVLFGFIAAVSGSLTARFPPWRGRGLQKRPPKKAVMLKAFKDAPHLVLNSYKRIILYMFSFLSICE